MLRSTDVERLSFRTPGQQEMLLLVLRHPALLMLLVLPISSP